MESAAYNSKNGLYKILCQFLPNGRDPECTLKDGDAGGPVKEDTAAGSEEAAEHIHGSCFYCGAPVAQMPMDIGGFQDNICPLCRRELIRQRDLFHEIVDETIRNVKYMFSLPWDKSIWVKKYNELKEPADSGKKKKDSSTWTVSLESQFVQAEMDDAREICTFKIRNAIPEGIVAASAAYTVAHAYLHLADKSEKLDLDRMSGLSYWYMIHYLHCMDHERYSRHYETIVEQLIPKAGVKLYRELQEKRRNRSSQVFSFRQDLALAKRPKEDETALDTHNAESDSKSDGPL